jgi:hypothetical protein
VFCAPTLIVHHSLAMPCWLNSLASNIPASQEACLETHADLAAASSTPPPPSS